MSHNVNRTIKHSDALSLEVNIDGGIPIFQQIFQTIHVSHKIPQKLPPDLETQQKYEDVIL